MAMMTSTQAAAATIKGDQCVTLRGIGWKGFLDGASTAG